MFPELRDSDVVVTNSRGVFDAAIAEYVLGQSSVSPRTCPDRWELQQRTRWQHRETERIAGRPVLIVGTGPIGRAIARLLRAAGMNMVGVGRRRSEADPDFGDVYRHQPLRGISRSPTTWSPSHR